MLLLALTGCAWLFEVPEEWTPEERRVLRTQDMAEGAPQKVNVRPPTTGVLTGKLQQPQRRAQEVAPISTSDLMEGAKPITTSSGKVLETGRGIAKRSQRHLRGMSEEERKLNIADTNGTDQ